MPRPPDHREDFQINFVVNQLLAGCLPPAHLIVEFAAEPAAEVLMLFLPGSWEDIVQGMFDSPKARKRKPARHGRKKPRFGGIPDVDGLLGKKLAGDDFARAAMKLPGARYAFPLLNVYEGFNFFTAILEGLTDTGFAGMSGFFKVKPDACVEFPRFQRTAGYGQIIGAPPGGTWPIFAPDLQFSNAYVDGSLAATCYDTNHAVSISAAIHNDTESGFLGGGLAIDNLDTGERTIYGPVEVPPGSTVGMSVSMEAEAGQTLGWGWYSEGGHGRLASCNVMGYGEVDWLTWAR